MIPYTRFWRCSGRGFSIFEGTGSFYYPPWLVSHEKIFVSPLSLCHIRWSPLSSWSWQCWPQRSDRRRRPRQCCSRPPCTGPAPPRSPALGRRGRPACWRTCLSRRALGPPACNPPFPLHPSPPAWCAGEPRYWEGWQKSANIWSFAKPPVNPHFTLIFRSYLLVSVREQAHDSDPPGESLLAGHGWDLHLWEWGLEMWICVWKTTISYALCGKHHWWGDSHLMIVMYMIKLMMMGICRSSYQSGYKDLIIFLKIHYTFHVNQCNDITM